MVQRARYLTVEALRAAISTAGVQRTEHCLGIPASSGGVETLVSLVWSV
jgi:hypothetical protein